MTSQALLERVRRTMSRHGLIQAGASVLVGVSGGPDSVALLALLYQLRKTLGIRQLHVAHVHHGWRGAEADADAVHVTALAQRYGLPVSVERVDAAGCAKVERLSPEDAARRVRYDALSRLARQCGAGVVAVGHTRDDQAETVLMRLVRGSGLAGAAGMPIVRSLGPCRLIRPLLEVRRRDVETFLAAEGLTARHDATNADTTLLRNRVRHQLLPLLAREYNGHITEALARWAEEARADYACLEATAQAQWLAACTSTPDGGVGIALAWLSRAPLALQRQMLRLAIRTVKGDLLQIDFRHWEEVSALISERPAGARVDLPGGISVTKQDRHLAVLQAAPSANAGIIPMAHAVAS